MQFSDAEFLARMNETIDFIALDTAGRYQVSEQDMKRKKKIEQ